MRFNSGTGPAVKSNRKWFALLVGLGLIISVGGCAPGPTPYQKMVDGFGYSDFQLNEDTFSISYRGNEYTSREDVKKYLLRRAAEMTLANGFTWFTPVSREDNTQTTYETETSSTFGGYGYHPYPYRRRFDPYYGYINDTEVTLGRTYTHVKPELQFNIKCFKQKPDRANATIIDAKFFLEKNFGQ